MTLPTGKPVTVTFKSVEPQADTTVGVTAKTDDVTVVAICAFEGIATHIKINKSERGTKPARSLQLLLSFMVSVDARLQFNT